MPQSLAKIYIHAVFSTKNREPRIAEDWQDDLHNVLGGALKNHGCQSLIIGGVADHVHILFDLGRITSVAKAIGNTKIAGSTWVNQEIILATPFHWQLGYAAFSVSQSNVESVREYIRTQKEHHQKESFQDELRKWLRRYEIEWDERFVWD